MRINYHNCMPFQRKQNISQHNNMIITFTPTHRTKKVRIILLIYYIT